MKQLSYPRSVPGPRNCAGANSHSAYLKSQMTAYRKAFTVIECLLFRRVTPVDSRRNIVRKPRSFKLEDSSTKEPIVETTTVDTFREPWNKGKLVGQKTPFKLKEIWAIRIRLQITRRCRDLALFNLAVDSKLRACDS